jgi:hypothetical protein
VGPGSKCARATGTGRALSCQPGSTEGHVTVPIDSEALSVGALTRTHQPEWTGYFKFRFIDVTGAGRRAGAGTAPGPPPSRGPQACSACSAQACQRTAVY